MIVLAGGSVLTSDGWAIIDVGIEEGRISALGADLSGERIDVAGCLVGPAFVDLHTHLREPGQTWKEDIESGSRAAAAGGFGAVVAMPNTDPAMDTVEIVETVAARGREVGLVDVVPAAALTVGRSGTEPVNVEKLYGAGIRIFTDDGDSVADPRVLRSVMVRVADLPGAIVAQHAEDAAMTADGHLHEGETSQTVGIGGLPATAESSIVARDLELVRQTGAPYHCQHVSSRLTLDLIREAKAAGQPVTAEVTPHHLSFDESYLETLDTNFKMYPPIRTGEDRAALVAGLTDGTIDVVATDHAPHSPEEKSVTFTDAPRGVIGLETAASAVWSEGLSPDRLFETMSMAPARIARLEDHGNVIARGKRANVVVFDPHASWEPRDFVSRSANSPYLGRPLQGRVRITVHDGTIVHQNGVQV